MILFYFNIEDIINRLIINVFKSIVYNIDIISIDIKINNKRSKNLIKIIIN